MPRPRLIIASGKEKAILRRHPWIFSGAVRRKEGNPQEGDLVDVFSSDGKWLAVGHFQDDSIICKVLSFDNPVFDSDSLKARLLSAINYRRRMGFFEPLKHSSIQAFKPLKHSSIQAFKHFEPLKHSSIQAFKHSNNVFEPLKHSSIQAFKHSTNVFRLVNGEGDNLPGLICDWYAGTLVMQAHSVGMHRLFDALSQLFVELLSPLGLLSIYDKSSATLPGGCDNAFLWGEEQEEREVCENGCRMMINFVEGQKTGFFVDQRENRQLVGSLAQGCRVLNCFGYTGGFSLAALHGGAEYVETVDISKRAIELCNRNVELNFGQEASHRGVVADVLKYLDMPVEKPFDLIVLDPPAFAKNHRSLQQGLKGYRNINQKAMERIADGGLLFTFSCSQAVSPDDFQTMLFSAAAAAHKSVRIVRHLPHAVDHPVSIYHPEGLYLKGLLVEVEK